MSIFETLAEIFLQKYEYIKQNWLSQIIEKVFILLVVLILSFLLLWLANRAINKVAVRSKIKLLAIKPYINGFIKLFVILIFVSTIFSILGIDLLKYLQMLATFGVGVGFVIQSSVSNLISGIIIKGFGNFKEGDIILLPDVADQSVKGKITEIRLTETILMSIDGKEMIIPNSRLANNIVTKLSTGEEKEEIIIKEEI